MEMYNMLVKFGQKIPNRLGKMPENFRGWGLTHCIADSFAGRVSDIDIVFGKAPYHR